MTLPRRTPLSAKRVRHNHHNPYQKATKALLRAPQISERGRLALRRQLAGSYTVPRLALGMGESAAGRPPGDRRLGIVFPTSDYWESGLSEPNTGVERVGASSRSVLGA